MALRAVEWLVSSPRHAYVARINRVIDHIDGHLADPLDLATLAGVAHFSAWHFHRVFQAMTGETLADCVRRRRLEVAAARLLGLPPEPVLAIALDVGFGSARGVHARLQRALRRHAHGLAARRLPRLGRAPSRRAQQDSSSRSQVASSRGGGLPPR